MKTYRIKKILNNNVVAAVSGFQEVIVVGLGVGYRVKTHDKVDPRKIEKVFELKQADYYKTSQLVKDIPEEMFFDVYRIIETVSKEEKIALDSHAYIALVDHIHFALERHKSGQDIRNLLNNDLRILYPNEFRFGEKLRMLINSKYGVSLPEDEIGFLTMHIVNGAHTDISNQSTILTECVFDCLNIVRDTYLIPLKMESLHTQRIMIHIKMLIQRTMGNLQVDFKEPILYNVVDEFDSAYKCAQKIQNYIENRLNTKINAQELVYLTIHLNRLEMMSKDKEGL